MLVFFHVPLPLIGGSRVPLGAIALTATAGVAGWLEFSLLRWSLGRRIGAVHVEIGYLVRLWSSAIVAGAAAAAFDALLLPRVARLLPHFLIRIWEGALVCGIFGVIYFAAAMLLGVPEARATLGRFLLRSRS